MRDAATKCASVKWTHSANDGAPHAHQLPSCLRPGDAVPVREARQCDQRGPRAGLLRAGPAQRRRRRVEAHRPRACDFAQGACCTAATSVTALKYRALFLHANRQRANTLKTMSDLHQTLRTMGLPQLLLALIFLCSYGVALGGMLGATGRWRAGGVAALSAFAFGFLTDPWEHAVMMVAFA